MSLYSQYDRVHNGRLPALNLVRPGYFVEISKVAPPRRQDLQRAERGGITVLRQLRFSRLLCVQSVLKGDVSDVHAE